MDVSKILRSGYFDHIRITGEFKPIYDSDGIDITSGDTFKNSVGDSAESFKNGVAQLKIYIIGESIPSEASSIVERMREDRKEAGLKCIETINGVDRYVVAYMNILIIKGDNAITFGIEDNGKSTQSFEKLAKTADMLELMLSAFKLNKHIKSRYRYTDDYINIAIIEKVYVLPIFRRSGISEWLHNNIGDIINMFALVWPTGLILTYGDFSNEAETNFKMSTEHYNNMLYTHYKKLGYESIRKITQSNDIGSANIMYKLLI